MFIKRRDADRSIALAGRQQLESLIAQRFNEWLLIRSGWKRLRQSLVKLRRDCKRLRPLRAGLVFSLWWTSAPPSAPSRNILQQWRSRISTSDEQRHQTGNCESHSEASNLARFDSHSWFSLRSQHKIERIVMIEILRIGRRPVRPSGILHVYSSVPEHCAGKGIAVLP